MWNVSIYLRNKKSPEDVGDRRADKALKKELLKLKKLGLSEAWWELKRQASLTELDIPGAIKRLEDGVSRLENCTELDKLKELGRDVDLSSREVALYLSTVISYSNDFVCDEGYINWLKDSHKRAVNLIQKAHGFFEKYSGWPFDFFSECAIDRINYLTKTAEEVRPELIRGN